MIPASLSKEVSDNVSRTLDFALENIGVCEDPVGSNRGPEIDVWAREFGSPAGSFWCAIAVAKARKEGGLWIPAHDAGACNEWLYEARLLRLTTDTPVPRAAVLYTNRVPVPSGPYAGQLDVVHVGLVLRVTPVLMSIEGNTTLGKYDRNGYVQTLKEVDRSRVLCYVLPGVAVKTIPSGQSGNQTAGAAS